jgi:HNH endonuclease
MLSVSGCANSLYKQVHHLRHEAHGGPTDTENCLLLCSFHYHLVHEGGWKAFGNADGQVFFVSPRAKLLTDVPAETRPALFQPIYGPDARTIQTATGERLDLDLAAFVIAQICGRKRSDN